MQDDNQKVAFVYWCDGTGHAARSIPVLKELESRDVEFSVAGGGPGKKFVELNGFDHPGLTEVAFKGSNAVEIVRNIIFDIVPSCTKRFIDIYKWLGEEDPDKIVTDDALAGLAAALNRVEIYRIDHLTPELFDWKIGLPFRLYNFLSLNLGEGIIVTSLWKDEEDPEGYKRVGPLAQEGETDDEIDEYDVLLSPGTHGEDFDLIKKKLESKGMSVRVVGDDNWETKPSMTPYTEKADVVICTGFSSIADTVVAGTHCIVYPFLPFQKGIAKGIEERNLKGLQVVRSVEESVEAAEKCVKTSCDTPEYENGAEEFVDELL